MHPTFAAHDLCELMMAGLAKKKSLLVASVKMSRSSVCNQFEKKSVSCKLTAVCRLCNRELTYTVSQQLPTSVRILKYCTLETVGHCFGKAGYN